MKEVAGTLDFVLSTVNADQDWGVYVHPTAHWNALLCWRSALAGQRSCLSAYQRTALHQRQPDGSPYQLKEMLDVAARHGIKATTESFPMAQANAAIEKVKKNKVRYRAVLAN